VFGTIAFVVVSSPGWERVQAQFFDWENFAESAPDIVAKFWVNVRLFVIAELLILVLGLALAVMRSLPGPVLFPLRLLSTIYVDMFRALPGVLVIYVLGFGIPGLRIPGVPNDPFFWGVVALMLLYSAYVSEVYRAGIDSVHPSQAAAARSLGLTQLQAMRHVVLPQAVRRVIPPLLNDFIGLQKDTVLVSFIGVVEIFRQSQIRQAATFNYTPYLVTALVFLAVTIPLARFTDWLVSRERDRRYAASVRSQSSAARRGRLFGWPR
jgi:polar amino acid transport system permease protein